MTRFRLSAPLVLAFALFLTSVASPSSAAFISQENCGNCVDDDGDGLVDRRDTADCAPPADGMDQGIGDVVRGKVLANCAKAVQKAGFKFLLGTMKSLQKCTEAAATCIQAKPGDAGCKAKATATCAKIAAGFSASTAKLQNAIVAKCDPNGQNLADLTSLMGLGFQAEQAPCNENEHIVPDLSTIANLTTCIAQQHFCRAQHLIAVTTPRARELLTFAGRLPSECHCIDEGGVPSADGGGAGVAAAHVKKLLKCSKTIDKLTQSFIGAGAKTVQTCLDAGIACEQVKGNDPACVVKARAKCSIVFAKLEDPAKGTLAKLTAKFTKACGVQDGLDLDDLTGPSGLALGSEEQRCFALGAFDLAQCFGAQAFCEAGYVVEREVPRARELADFLHVILPGFAD